MNIITVSKKEEDIKNYFQDILKNNFRDCLNPEYSKWQWQYLKNPFFPERNPPVWLCDLDGRKIGHLGAIPVEIKIGLQKILGAWAVDFMTLSEYRGKGAGRLLVNEANKHFHTFMTIGCTDMASMLFIKMGWKFLGDVPHFIKILDLRVLIKEKIKNLFIAKLLFITIKPLLLFDYLKMPKRIKEIEVQRIDDFNEEADLLWNEIASYYKIVVHRNRAYLQWKYTMQPNMDYVKFCARHNQKLRGYAIVRSVKTESDEREGLIADIISRPNDRKVIIALVSSCLEYLKSENCFIAHCYVNHKGIQNVLGSFGFVRRRSQMRFLLNKNVNGLEEIYDLNNWYLTAGDCDIDR